MTGIASGCEIVRYDELAKGSLAGLQKLLWSPSERLNAEYFEWKYERNPYTRKPHVYAAMADGMAVGMRGFCGGRWEVGGSTPAPSAMCAGDLVIDPAYRGRGLFARIMARALDDLAREDVPFVLNFSAGAATRLISQATGWGVAGPLQRMQRGSTPGWEQRLASLALRIARRTRARSLERLLERRSSSRGKKLEAPVSLWEPFARYDRGRRTKLGDGRAAIVESDLARPREMADLVRRAGYDGRIRHVRDETYFGWRFGSPLSTYRFFYLERGEGYTGQLDAFLIMQASLYPVRGKFMRIADWTGTTEAGQSAVLHAALATVKHDQLDIWTGTLAEESRATLRDSGFVDYKVRSLAQYFPTVLVRPTGPSAASRPWLFGGRDALDLASWDLRMLDSDGT